MNSLFTQNSTSIRDWTILFTNGTCLGQFRQLLSVAVGLLGETVTFSLLNISDGTRSSGPYGNQLWTSYKGCAAPDNSSSYILISKSRATGSMVASTFAVRWAGYLATTVSSQYTFWTMLSGSNSNVERVKVTTFHFFLVCSI